MQRKARVETKQRIILSALYLFIIIILTRFIYAYGSTMDWLSQHSVFPDYFRKLFYDTGDPFPDFAANIGAGQNIYDFSYYGLFSPIILLSYLFPFIRMDIYIQIISIVGLWVSVMLFHRFLSKRFGLFAAFTASLLFLLSPPLIFHSHRHIMFIAYMPFLILAYEAADRLITQGKRTFLIAMLVLMILCNYYFSIPALISVTVYAVYSFIKRTPKIIIKEFFKKAAEFAFCVITSIMISGVLLLPTMAAVSGGRDDNNIPFDPVILIPHFIAPASGVTPQAIGLSAFGILAVIVGVASKNRERRFISVFIAVINFCPIFIWILNGGMYIDGKVLIPFIPLMLIMTAYLFEDFKKGNRPKKYAYIILAAVTVLDLISYETKYDAAMYVSLLSTAVDAVAFAVFMLIYMKKRKKRLIVYASALVTVLATIIGNYTDPYVETDVLQSENSETINKMASFASSDSELVRTSVCARKADTANKVYNTDHYDPYIYSSINNELYKNFYFNTIHNENEYRNSALMTCSWNVFFNNFMANKYLISNQDEAPTGYELVYRDKEYSLYKNNYSLPFARSSDNIISEKYFDTLSPAQQAESLMNYIVVDDDPVKTTVISSEKEYRLPRLPESKHIKPEKDEYFISSDNNFTVKVPLERPVLKSQLMFISMDVDNSKYDCDARIKINSMRNTLTAPSWKYYNNNEHFEFIISTDGKERIDELTVKFSEGKYRISNIKCSLIDYPDKVKLTGRFNADKEKTKGDVIQGTIDCSDDGYFMMTVPYDENFDITVDGKKTEYECVDKAFIGFRILKGKHDIKAEYHAPLKKEGIAVTCAGLLLFTANAVYELIKRYRKK